MIFRTLSLLAFGLVLPASAGRAPALVPGVLPGIASALPREKPLRASVQQDASGQQDARGPALRLELFDGRTVLARTERVATTRGGGVTWLGRFEGQPGAYAAFAAHGEVVMGTVFENGLAYEVRGDLATGLVLKERQSHACVCTTVRPGRFGHDSGRTAAATATTGGPSGPPPYPGPVLGGTSLGVKAPGPTSLPLPLEPVADLLFVWTQEAEDLLGGASAAQAMVDLAVLETNVVLDNSESILDVRLVHSQQIAGYVEAQDMAVDLDRLLAPADGFLDGVHALRDQYGADAVALLLADDDACGRSVNMSSLTSGFADYAFTLVSQSCATTNWALAHELGHTFGLDHDRLNTSSTPSHPFAYGFWLANGVYRSMMALPRWGVTGVRIPYYSNPGLLYLNQHVLGVPYPGNQSSDCRLALDLNAKVIASWRPTQVP